MTPDRGPDGRSLGHSHVEHVQPPNRGYAGYYLPNLYQENYRIRSAEELDALPIGSIVVGVDPDRDAWAYCKRVDYGHSDPEFWQWDHHRFARNGMALLEEIADTDEWLFLAYRPDMVAPRRDPA